MTPITSNYLYAKLSAHFVAVVGMFLSTFTLFQHFSPEHEALEIESGSYLQLQCDGCKHRRPNDGPLLLTIRFSSNLVMMKTSATLRRLCFIGPDSLEIGDLEDEPQSHFTLSTAASTAPFREWASRSPSRHQTTVTTSRKRRLTSLFSTSQRASRRQ
jgi:hypothetical protein